jgi:glycosyltransferase involved in cell wall biosynthesis
VKVLVLSGESPLPANSGSRLRVLHLARALAQVADVDLAVLGEVNGTPAEPFRLVGAGRARPPVLGFAGAVRRPYEVAKHVSRPMLRLAASALPDVVQATPSVLPAAWRAGRPVVLDAHNVEAAVLRTFAERERSQLGRARWSWEAAKMERWERKAVRGVRAVCATSEEDAAVFEREGAREVVVVPNGVDCGAIVHRPPAAGATVLFVGHFGYRPNVYAARELADEVLPRLRTLQPKARLVLVGRDSGPELRGLASPEVEVAGAVPSVLPYLLRSRVTVLPLRAGSGSVPAGCGLEMVRRSSSPKRRRSWPTPRRR